MNAPTVNPRRAKYTDRKRAQRAAMGRRWEQADRARVLEMYVRWIDPQAAWRRWQDSEAAAPGKVAAASCI